MTAGRLLAALVATIVAAAVAVGGARADGDPASDYLIAQQVFFPYDAKVPRESQQRLLAAVRSANEQGFRIRVALIWSDYDLGSVTALWKQPRRYARFLGAELAYSYKGRLLVVMPNGLGFNQPGRDPSAAYALLRRVRVTPTPGGLADAGTEAVRRLAAAAGITVSTVGSGPAPSSRTTRDRAVLAAAALAALLLGAGLRLAVRRRAARAGR